MDTNIYDSLLSHEGGSDFFETVLGGLAHIDNDNDSDDDISIISTGSSIKSSDSDKSSGSKFDPEEQSPLFESSSVNGGFEEDNSDKEDEESPLFDSASIVESESEDISLMESEINAMEAIESDKDESIFIEKNVKKNSDDIKNLIKEMIKSL